MILMLVSVLLTKGFCILAKDTRLMDKPNERSMHKVPVVRGGGIVFITLSTLSFLFFGYLKNYNLKETYVLLFSILFLALINFFDDLHSISAKARFFVQSLIAVLIICWINPVQLDFVIFSINNQMIVSIFLFFSIIWAINHFNFMDGLDGFCASQAIFLFSAYALIFFVYQAYEYQFFCEILAACIVGFFILNFPPAKLFMGDVGSATLGLISFGLAIVGQHKYGIPILYWFILNSLFLFDSTITLIRRFLNGEKLYVAHKKHAYQRVKQLGLSSRMLLLIQLIINIALFLFMWLDLIKAFPSYGVILLSIGVLCCIYIIIEKRRPMFSLSIAE